MSLVPNKKQRRSLILIHAHLWPSLYTPPRPLIRELNSCRPFRLLDLPVQLSGMATTSPIQKGLATRRLVLGSQVQACCMHADPSAHRRTADRLPDLAHTARRRRAELSEVLAAELRGALVANSESYVGCVAISSK